MGCKGADGRRILCRNVDYRFREAINKAHEDGIVGTFDFFVAFSPMLLTVSLCLN